MVKITDTAKQQLKTIVETRNLESGKFLRLATPPIWEGEGDFGIVISEEGAHDFVVKHEDVDVLLVDSGLMEQMPTAVLDYKDTPNGLAFTLDVY